jgi:phosphate transport system protein
LPASASTHWPGSKARSVTANTTEEFPAGQKAADHAPRCDRVGCSSHGYRRNGPGRKIRTAYHEQLAELTAQLGEMCRLAGAAMKRATHALLQADLVLAEQVISDHETISAMNARAEEKAFVLLARQAPVAGDLRAIVSSLQSVADVKHMHALALQVAKIARRCHPQPALPEEINRYFAEMGRLAVEFATGAQEVLLCRDPYKAARIGQQDDAMDDLRRHLFTVLMDAQWNHSVAAAVDVTLLGTFYERFADHAVEVARRVIFQATGKHPHDEQQATGRLRT